MIIKRIVVDALTGAVTEEDVEFTPVPEFVPPVQGGAL